MPWGLVVTFEGLGKKQWLIKNDHPRNKWRNLIDRNNPEFNEQSEKDWKQLCFRTLQYLGTPMVGFNNSSGQFYMNLKKIQRNKKQRSLRK